MRKLMIGSIVLVCLIGGRIVWAQEEEVDIKEIREYIRSAFRITTVSNQVLDFVLGEEFEGIPWLKWIGWLIRADQIYGEFTEGEYSKGVYLAYRTGLDRAFVEVMEIAGLPGAAIVARLAFSPIERAILKFYDNAVMVAIQNQTKLYCAARALGCIHEDILRGIDFEDRGIYFDDGGWLYIVGDLKVPSYGPVRPGGNSREQIYGLAYDVYQTIIEQDLYEQDKKILGKRLEAIIAQAGDVLGGVDIALVIDRSGSMTFPITDLGRTPRIEVAKRAAEEFADFIGPEDYLGIVDFAGDVKIPAQGYFEDSEEIKKVIQGIRVREWNGTAIGLALQVCFEGFKTLPHSNQLIVLLTDGCNNLPPDPFKLITKDSPPIFTIGLGSGEEFNEPDLRRIADLTGGMYKHVDFASLEELGDFYGFIGGLMRGATTLVKERGFINQNQKINRSFFLEEGAKIAYVNLNWGGSTLSAKLYNSQGELLLPGRKGEVYLGFDLVSPPGGEYQMEIEGEEVEGGGEPYILSVAQVSSVLAYFHPFKSLYKIGEPFRVKVEVRVKDKGRWQSIRCEGNISIKDPRGRWETSDSPDCEYNLTFTPGPYFVRAKIEGQDLGGQPFKKVLEEMVWVGSREALMVNPDSLEPKPGSKIDNSKPRISAQILGPRKNIVLQDIRLFLDDQKLDFAFDEIDQQISWKTLRALRPGKHTVELRIRSKQGQALPLLIWFFSINRSPKPEAKVNPELILPEGKELFPGKEREWFDAHNLKAINFPNPFSRETNFAVWLKEAGEIRIKIFNAEGKEVDNFSLSGQSGFNQISWQAQNKQGEPLSPGCYFYMVQARDFVVMRKITIQR